VSLDASAELARQCAAAMYAEDRASRHLGIEVSDVAPGRATARMVVTDAMVNGHGICYGGYLFLLADSAFAFACNTYGAVTVAAAAEIVFVAPGRLGDELTAEARERVRYGRSGLYDVTVRSAVGSVLAEFRGTSRALRARLLPSNAAETMAGTVTAAVAPEEGPGDA
jgi:acyl-CoA thioesterase